MPIARRTILKKALYVAPVLISLPCVPSFASVGSNARKWIGTPNTLPKEKGDRRFGRITIDDD